MLGLHRGRAGGAAPPGGAGWQRQAPGAIISKGCERNGGLAGAKAGNLCREPTGKHGIQEALCGKSTRKL